TLGNESGGQERSARRLDERKRKAVIGHTNTDIFTRRKRDAPGHFLGGLEKEGVGARCCQHEKALLTVVDASKMADFRKVAAQQRKVMTLVEAAQAAQRFSGRFVVESRHHGVTGIGWNGYQTAFGQQLACLGKQPGLRILGVNNEELSH